jgi:hypothetical protein
VFVGKTQVHVEVIVGLRALIGVEDVGGRYKARRVHYDGCPDVIVPALTHLVTQVCGGREQMALNELLSCDWTRIHLHTGTGARPARLALQPSPNLAFYPAEIAAVADGRVGDKEWAYLFGGRRLHIYLGVQLLDGGTAWEPWACWPVTDLPHLPRTELLDVQKSGYARQREMSAEASYVAALAERFGWNRAELARTFDELTADECEALGLDPTGRFGQPYRRSVLTGGQRARLRELKMRGGR